MLKHRANENKLLAAFEWVFAYWRKVAISFVAFASSYCQLCSHWKCFRDILYRRISLKSVEKTHTWVQSDRSAGNFTWRLICGLFRWRRKIAISGLPASETVSAPRMAEEVWKLRERATTARCSTLPVILLKMFSVVFMKKTKNCTYDYIRCILTPHLLL